VFHACSIFFGEEICKWNVAGFRQLAFRLGLNDKAYNLKHKTGFKARMNTSVFLALGVSNTRHEK